VPIGISSLEGPLADGAAPVREVSPQNLGKPGRARRVVPQRRPHKRVGAIFGLSSFDPKPERGIANEAKERQTKRTELASGGSVLSLK
jgi:hypothetical protein